MPNAVDGEDEFGLAELIPQYLALCRADLEKLRSALLGRRFAEVRIVGHNLKGSGGAYGFPELTDIGALIESSAKAEDESAMREGVARLSCFLTSAT